LYERALQRSKRHGTSVTHLEFEVNGRLLSFPTASERPV
jgi:hypothetical protein